MDNNSSDKDAFVFQIRSSKGYKPFISNVKQDEKSISTALAHDSTMYGIFGGGSMIIGLTWWGYAGHFVDHDTADNYEEFEHECPFLGGLNRDDLKDFEVFQMIDPLSK